MLLLTHLEFEVITNSKLYY